MRNVPYEIATALNSASAIEPVMFVDVYYQNEGEDSLSTAYRLRGDADVSKGEDSRVEYNPSTSAMMLSHGAVHAADSSAALVGGVQLLDWYTHVTDLYDTDHKFSWQCQASLWGHCVLWTPTIVSVYLHQGYKYEDTTDSVSQRDFRFTAPTTKRVDSLVVGLGNAAGDIPASITATILDSATGTPVGSSASVTLAAGAAHAKVTIGSAMAARLFSGRDYILRLTMSPAFVGGLKPTCNKAAVRERHGCYVTVSGMSSAESDWVIQLRNPATNADIGKIALGGYDQYAATGQVVRNLNVGAVPAADGVLGITSNVPLGTALSVSALYGTDSASVAAETTTTPAHWNLVSGPYADGMALPPYRYWRVVFALTANAGRDVSPQLQDVSIVFSGPPITLGTMAGAVSDASGKRKVTAVRALNGASASSQSLDPAFKTTMIGRFTVDLAPEPEVLTLAQHKLRGKRVVVRIGVRGIDMTMHKHVGVVRDLSWNKQHFVLDIEDPVAIADVSIPNQLHADWSSAVTYQIGELVCSGDKAYRSLQNGNLNHAVTDSAWWEPYPSVWVPITYPFGTHLADIVSDLLTNHINLPDRYIDSASIAAVKTRHASRTITASLTFDQPTKARDLMDELAMLLEAQWVVRDGRMALVSDPSISDTPVAILGKHDIKEGIEWRRGFADIKNAVIVLSGYSNTGGNEQWSRGSGIVNGTSVGDYSGLVVQKELRDRFGLSESELASIANNYLTRWGDGKRVIRVDAYLKHIGIEAGDVVRLISAQLPESEPQDITCQVVQSSLDWLALSVKLTLVEV